MMIPLKKITDNVVKAKHLARDFQGKEMNVPTLKQFMLEVGTAFKISNKTLPRAALAESLRCLEDNEPTYNLLYANALHVASNRHLINIGTAAPIWRGEPIFVAAYVYGLWDAGGTLYGRRTLKLQLRILAGVPAGAVLEAFVTTDDLSRQLGAIGITEKEFGDYPEQVAGCYLTCTLSRPGNYIIAKGLKATSAMKKRNKELATRRDSPCKCTKGRLNCWSCGATTDKCGLAVWLPEKEL